MKLGRFEQVDVRDQWRNEEKDFTPWLAKEENMAVLSEAINLDLDVEGTEEPVGNYRADIVAIDELGRKVVIENQLGKTDHKHLGQIMTYASGVDASIIIWIATQITEPHRQAIDWLNQSTNEDLAFFACEVELWKIDDSLPAPRFKVVCRPNDWSKSIKIKSQAKELSSTKEEHLRFWSGFNEFVEEGDWNLRLRTPTARHWYSIAIGRSKFQISLTRNTKSDRIGCELYIRGKRAKTAYSMLIDEKEAIEERLGALEWQELPEGQDCRIILYNDASTRDESKWAAQYQWLIEQAELFDNVFRARIKSLSLGD